MGDANRWFFQDAGSAVFHLHVSLDGALARTRGDASRPLLATGRDTVRRLYALRLPRYRELGTPIGTDGRTAEEVAAEIAARLHPPR
jgi:shikimate kinase